MSACNVQGWSLRFALGTAGQSTTSLCFISLRSIRSTLSQGFFTATVLPHKCSSAFANLWRSLKQLLAVAFRSQRTQPVTQVQRSFHACFVLLTVWYSHLAWSIVLPTLIKGCARGALFQRKVSTEQPLRVVLLHTFLSPTDCLTKNDFLMVVSLFTVLHYSLRYSVRSTFRRKKKFLYNLSDCSASKGR